MDSLSCRASSLFYICGSGKQKRLWVVLCCDNDAKIWGIDEDKYPSESECSDSDRSWGQKWWSNWLLRYIYSAYAAIYERTQMIDILLFKK